MNLPQINHYSLDELADRWRLPLTDLRYFAENGALEVQTWMDLPVVELFRLIQTIEGTTVPVGVGLDSYRDFAVVEPPDVRKIFRCPRKPSAIKHIRPIKKADIMRPLYHTDHSPIAANDLVVSRDERDRFERDHNIPHVSERGDDAFETDDLDAFMPPVSFAGRPSIMRKINAHFMERCKAKLLEPSLQKEGDYLVAWAQIHIKDAQIPTAQTIRTAIRAQYREQASNARV